MRGRSRRLYPGLWTIFASESMDPIISRGSIDRCIKILVVRPQRMSYNATILLVKSLRLLKRTSLRPIELQHSLTFSDVELPKIGWSGHGYGDDANWDVKACLSYALLVEINMDTDIHAYTDRPE